MAMNGTIDITPDQRETLISLLSRYLPDTETWIYGSRVRGTSRPQSDLDMVVFATPEQARGVSDLRESLEESNLPFRVDLFVWDDLPGSFHDRIEREHAVLIDGIDQETASKRLFDTLPDGWEYTTLGIACATAGGNIQTGPFGSQLHASDYVPSGIPSIMPQNIGDNRIHADGIAHINPSDASRLSRYLVQEGDIVYSRRGDVKRRALVRTEEDGWLCGTGCLRIRFGNNGVDSRYASYYLRHPNVQDWIVRHAHGATMPNLNTSILSECPFIIPSKSEQRAIAHLLGALDDKIELNRRMNEILEAMARAIFKNWFVDFGPTRAKIEGRAPYLTPELWALFPDALDDEDKPIGWKHGTLADVAESPRRGVNPADVSEETPYIGLEHMPRRSIALSEQEGAGKVKSNKTRFHKGEILFGKLRPYFHKVGIAPLSGICSTDIVVVVPRTREWRAFALACMSSDEFVDYTTRTSTGTRMPRTSWKTMAQYKICLPSGQIVRAFQDIAHPLIDGIGDNIHESAILTEIRDLLLPKLISGEIRLRPTGEGL